MSDNSVFLIGCGDHGRVVLETLLLQGVRVTGTVDPQLAEGGEVFGVPVISEEVVLAAQRTSARLVNGVGGRNDNSKRNEIYRRYRSLNFAFSGTVHPSVVIGRECAIHDSVQILAGAVVQQKVTIGENSVINTSSVVEHDSLIGDDCFLGPRVVLSGRVTVSNEVFIGAGAVVLPGVRIGKSARVGAGAVVTRDVDGGLTVVGNPARPMVERS